MLLSLMGTLVERLYGIMVNVLDCDVVVGEFQLQSCYYVYF